jgi:hypothetical protein
MPRKVGRERTMEASFRCLINVSDLRLSGEDTLVSFLLLFVFRVTLCIILIVLMIDMHSLAGLYVWIQ